MRTERYLTDDNRAEMIRQWNEALRMGAAKRDHWRLRPDEAGLLVIDVQRVFCSEEGAHFLPAFPACSAPLAQLIAAWRAAGRPVVFTRHGHTGDPGQSVHGRFHRSLLRRDDPEADLVSPACPVPGDRVFEKDTYDAFYGTGLADYLRARGCTQIVAAGVLTHLCVESTVRSAFVQGFEPFVAMDACASATARLHEASLVAMASGFAGILTVAQAVQS